MIKSAHIYSIRIKILYSVFCSPPLQNEASPISRSQYTLFMPVKLLKEVFEGLTLLTPKLTILMKISTTKILLSFLDKKDVGSNPRGEISHNGKEGILT